MELRATRDIRMGEKITPPIPPLSYILHRAFLSTRCSTCFRELASSIGTRLSGVKITFGDCLCPTQNCRVRYCSPECMSADVNKHLSSGDCHLLSMTFDDDELLTNLRLTIRLLFLFKDSPETTAHRVGGLLSNKDLIKNQSHRKGLKLLSAAWERENGLTMRNKEEAIFCAVLTNQTAVSVPDEVFSVGAAVYPPAFSYLNHNCSPNAWYAFDIFEDLLAEPHGQDLDAVSNAWNSQLSSPKGFNLRCPMVVVRCINFIKAGEEITISYVNNLCPKDIRSSSLKLLYDINCNCGRCDVLQHDKVQLEYEKRIDLSEVDEVFELIGTLNEPEVYVNCLDVLIGRLLIPNCDLQVKADPSLSLEVREDVSKQMANLTHKFEGVILHPVNYYMRKLFSAYLQAKTDSDDYKVEASFRCLLAASLYQLFKSEPSIIAHVAASWSLFGFALEQVYHELAREGDEVKEEAVGVWSENLICTRECKNVFNANISFSTEEDFKKTCDDIWTCVREIIPNVWPGLSKGIECLDCIHDPTSFDYSAAPSEESISRFIQFTDFLGRLSMGHKSRTVQAVRKKLTANG